VVKKTSTTGGLTLVVAGTWLGAQVFFGGLISRLMGDTPKPATPAASAATVPTAVEPLAGSVSGTPSVGVPGTGSGEAARAGVNQLAAPVPAAPTQPLTPSTPRPYMFTGR
jgi:hypothetical protein